MKDLECAKYDGEEVPQTPPHILLADSIRHFPREMRCINILMASYIQKGTVPNTSLNRFQPVRLLLLGAVEIAQIAVPADADDVDDEDAMVQRDELEVDHLHERPDQVVGRQGGLVVLLELLPRRGALQDGHAAEEDADEGRGEQTLVAGHARQDRAVGRAQVHVALQETEPGRRGRAEHRYRWRLAS